MNTREDINKAQDKDSVLENVNEVYVNVNDLKNERVLVNIKELLVKEVLVNLNLKEDQVKNVVAKILVNLGLGDQVNERYDQNLALKV